MQLEIIGMDGRVGEARTNDDLDAFAFHSRIELYQRVLVEPKLLLHALQAGGSHRAIVASWG